MFWLRASVRSLDQIGTSAQCAVQFAGVSDTGPTQSSAGQACVPYCYEEFIRASIRGRYTLSMKAPIKKFKRKRDPGMSFGELVQRLWQPESEEPEPKAARAKKKQSAGTPAQIRKK